MSSSAKKLKPAHIIFINQYLKSNNQSTAYRIAYPNAAPENACQLANQLLKNNNVAKCIAERKQEMLDVSQLDATKVAAFNWSVAQEARAEKEYSSAIKATQEVSKIKGLYHTADDQPQQVTQFFQQFVKVEGKALTPDEVDVTPGPVKSTDNLPVVVDVTPGQDDSDAK